VFEESPSLVVKEVKCIFSWQGAESIVPTINKWSRIVLFDLMVRSSNL
jgi:hypothetical protein